jgi:predicted secreted protein
MAINGNNILVYKGGTAIAGVKTDEIQVGCETIEISSPTTGEWRQYIAGRKEWSINVAYLVLATSGVRDVLNVGTTYTIAFKERGAADSAGVSGSAILTTCKISATRGNLVTGSFIFQGISALA